MMYNIPVPGICARALPGVTPRSLRRLIMPDLGSIAVVVILLVAMFLVGGGLVLLLKPQPATQTAPPPISAPATPAQPTRRKPPASLAGKVRENGDVMSSLTADDWGMDS